jgi:glycosyltransferase involved in cell wall biosynthesis
MSKRRSDMAAARRRASDFRPIPIVRVALESPNHDVAVDPRSSRVWVEVTRHGHVVGRAELAPSDGIVSGAALDELGAAFQLAGSPPAVVADEELPFASVVVPTICRNPKLLARTIQSLVDLDYPAFEVLVVDNTAPGSDPLPSLPGGDKVRVLREPLRGVSRARNCGLSAAIGEFVAFTDDDAEVDPRWLRALGTRFTTDPQVDAIGGLVLPRELQTEPQLWFEEFYGGFSQSYAPASWSTTIVGGDDELFPYAAGRFGAGCNMAFRREAIDRVGRFDVRLGAGTPARGGEDLAIFVAFVTSGATVGFEPNALVRHTHRRDVDEFFHQVLNYGVGLTAMYSALVANDPRHLVEMARRIPAGFRLLVRPREERSVSVDPSYPRRTILVQMLGMAVGPFAFLRSRRWAASRS